ncbi:MAG: hypothetical protein IJ218_00285 [Alphaproteobacteria bacterium]|nr:hypothetical protein [Alphaproteobacteria bacterium]
MEIYVLAALLFIYIITAATGNRILVRRIWTTAFIGAAFLTSGALFALRVRHQDVMLTADNFNWYFFLYVFGGLAFALGLINLWMYRRALWDMFRSHSEEKVADEAVKE